MIYVCGSCRYEVTDPTTDPVKFFAQGGGFEESMPHIKFHARFTAETTPPTWRAGIVGAEWFCVENDGTPEGREVTFPCWSDGDLWNGWGQPFFNKATIDDLLARFEQVGLAQKVSWINGKLMVNDPDEDEPYELPPLNIPGCAEPLYGLGAGSWTWDRITFNESAK